MGSAYEVHLHFILWYIAKVNMRWPISKFGEISVLFRVLNLSNDQTTAEFGHWPPSWRQQFKVLAALWQAVYGSLCFCLFQNGSINAATCKNSKRKHQRKKKKAKKSEDVGVDPVTDSMAKLNISSKNSKRSQRYSAFMQAPLRGQLCNLHLLRQLQGRFWLLPFITFGTISILFQ